MAIFINGHANGHNGTWPHLTSSIHTRFSDIPSALDIPVAGADAEEAVEVDLELLPDDPTELCTLLENENAAKNIWMVVSLAYGRQHKINLAIEILNRGLHSLSRGSSKEKIGLLSLLCWLYLWKSREAPRVAPNGQLVSEAKTKDFYLQAATGALNEASRVNPSFPPLFLARGILSLLRASLQPPSKNLAPGVVEQSERMDTLRQALKCFDDASRVSAGRNMMAILGKARTLFSLARYAEALDCYQDVLNKMPDLRDPDPRIGIGCCLWRLSHHEEAKEAWDRALELNPESSIASTLVGLYYIHDSMQYPAGNSKFTRKYRKAVTEYFPKAFKLDRTSPLSCITLSQYFYLRDSWNAVESLSRRAIELTDVNAIASDGWFLLARKLHQQTDRPNWHRALDFYNRTDNARGGGDRGFLPAKLGASQVMVLNNDIGGAKFRLDKLILHTKNLQAMVLLATLYAEDIYASQSSGSKEDKSAEIKRAIALFEAVRLSWKDSKKTIRPDSDILLHLARLYESDQPEKGLQCLLQAQQMYIDILPLEQHHLEIEDERLRFDAVRKHLPEELLNNIACFQFQLENYVDASSTFQTALDATVLATEDQPENAHLDALVTTVSYNLARTYDAAGLLDQGRVIYEGILERHADYTDARTRLAYIELRQHPGDGGPKAMAALYEKYSSDMEVRSLFGWYLSKAKKRVANIADDQEQRHYKHTLQHHDKHDLYSLTGMGNLYLLLAREMRRLSDVDRDKQRKTYEKAVEFHLKALQLDPKNAYAAQGIGVALAEEKKDFAATVQVFSKVKDTIKDASVHINLGHVYGELKQYSRAIECYEAALAKDRASDPQTVACLGRVWLLKGKQEKSSKAMENALNYSQRALELAPGQIHFKFNIAFVQFQLAQLLYTLSEHQRTLEEVEAAAIGLDAAIDSFTEIASTSNPPYPKSDIEQRANMGRNTMRNQLERAVQKQRLYEEENATKLSHAREIREKELQARETERLRIESEAAAKRAALMEDRAKMLEMSRELAEKRAEEERRKEEADWTVDSEGERVKRRRKPKATKRKKKEGDESDGSGEGDSAAPARRRAKRSESEVSGGVKAPRKKRRLATRAKNPKIKSAEMVVESESDEAGPAGSQAGSGDQATQDAMRDSSPGADVDMEGAEDEEMIDVEPAGGDSARRGRGARRVEEEEDEEEEVEEEDEKENGVEGKDHADSGDEGRGGERSMQDDEEEED